MKALNHKEINRSYFIFIGYFTGLLILTVFCWYLFIQTKEHFIRAVRIKKDEVDFFKQKNTHFSNRTDSINLFLALLNTNQVANEAALERSILKLKDEALTEIDSLEKTGDTNYSIYKKILTDVEKVIETKKVLHQEKVLEENNKTKLQNCNNANEKLRNR